MKTVHFNENRGILYILIFPLLFLFLLGCQDKNSSPCSCENSDSEFGVLKEFQESIDSCYVSNDKGAKLSAMFSKIARYEQDDERDSLDISINQYLEELDSEFEIKALGDTLYETKIAIKEIDSLLANAIIENDEVGIANYASQYVNLPIYFYYAPDSEDRAKDLKKCIIRCKRKFKDNKPRRSRCISKCKRKYRKKGGDRDGDQKETDRAREARKNELAKDPDNGGKVTEGSIREAEVALELEKQGKMARPIRRPKGPGKGDFLDGDGQEYDVKSPKSRETLERKLREKGKPVPTGKIEGEFDEDKEMDKIRENVKKGRKVIIDTKDIKPEQRDSLKEKVKQEKLGENVIFN